MTATLIFWASLGLLGYTLLGYPLAIALFARLRPQHAKRANDTPTVTVLLIAHDEAACIAQRLENLLALDYPPELLTILVCSDGSSDSTVALARACADPRVSVLAFEPRRGKAAVLDDAVPKATGEVIVFADARQRFDLGALRALVAPFADPRVGVVSGELCLEPGPGASTVGAGVGFYWRYEKVIRRAESLVDSSVGATGAIYAIRRRLFEPIPETTILDDVLIPMQIVRAGYRTLFEPTARAYDRVAASADREFARKVRTIAGTCQLFACHPWLLDPRRNRLWLQTASHKLLRLLGPFALASALVANLLLLDSRFYQALLTGQVLLYGAALFGHARSRRTRRRGRLATLLLGVPYAFCVLQVATVVGLVRFVAGRQTVIWNKAQSAPAHSSVRR